MCVFINILVCESVYFHTQRHPPLPNLVLDVKFVQIQYLPGLVEKSRVTAYPLTGQIIRSAHMQTVWLYESD